MTNYVDTYLACTDEATLQAFLTANGFLNVIAPQQGTAAQTATNPDGSTTTIAAKGVVGTFYACIRAAYDLSSIVALQAAAASTAGAPAISVCDPATGKAVIGVFA